jgi:hypothetical protein
VIELSAWACWKGILIENFRKVKKQEKQQQQLFLFLESLKMELPKNRIFNIFQI